MPDAPGSLPSRERGLKCKERFGRYRIRVVAPFTGAWIEIWMRAYLFVNGGSLPSRERGLK